MDEKPHSVDLASHTMPRQWVIVPGVALIVAAVSLFAGKALAAMAGFGIVWPLIEFIVLLAGVFASVHHADVVAHRLGEPYGTLVLTAAVTIIEVALILSIMMGGKGNPALARDTVYAVVMLVCNGLVGLCIVVGGLRYGEQGFRLSGTSAYLIVLIPFATLSLILPNATTTVRGPYFSSLQIEFVSFVTVALYLIFLYVQTVRHRDYFLSDDGGDDGHSQPDLRAFWQSIVQLVIALTAIVLLAKSFSVSLEKGVQGIGAPQGVVGLVVALLVLLPESFAAVAAARNNQLQKSLNLALGSSLATIGLTIPTVGVASILLGQKLELGLDQREVVMIVLTFAVSIVTFRSERTNILSGFVHLVLMATAAFLIFVP